MKIVVEDVFERQKDLSGDYQYLEGGETNGSPSFHIDFGEGLVYFYFDNYEELDKLIDELKDLKDVSKW